MCPYLFYDKSVVVVTLNAKDHGTVRRDNPNTIKLYPQATNATELWVYVRLEQPTCPTA